MPVPHVSLFHSNLLLESLSNILHSSSFPESILGLALAVPHDSPQVQSSSTSELIL
jgi:hypothetical protein